MVCNKLCCSINNSETCSASRVCCAHKTCNRRTYKLIPGNSSTFIIQNRLRYIISFFFYKMKNLFKILLKTNFRVENRKTYFWVEN